MDGCLALLSFIYQKVKSLFQYTFMSHASNMHTQKEKAVIYCPCISPQLYLIYIVARLNYIQGAVTSFHAPNQTDLIITYSENFSK